jgi:hypothetical protein
MQLDGDLPTTVTTGSPSELEKGHGQPAPPSPVSVAAMIQTPEGGI